MSEREQERMLQEIPLPEQKECKKAAERAMKLLLQQDRTRKELQDRLYRAGFSERAAEYALAYVSGYGYIDDFRYAGLHVDKVVPFDTALELQPLQHEPQIRE